MVLTFSRKIKFRVFLYFFGRLGAGIIAVTAEQSLQTGKTFERKMEAL